MLRSMRQLDIFPKSAPEVEAKGSALRGMFSLLSLGLLGTLLLLETWGFCWQGLDREVRVEVHQAQRQMRLDFNVSLYFVPCEAVSVDYEDSMGSHYNSFSVKKLRIDSSGRIIETSRIDSLREGELFSVSRSACGSCYGSELMESQCCDTCDEVFDAYARRGWFPPKEHEVAQCRRRLQSVSEGCQVFGHLMLREVPGAVHLTFPSKVTDLSHTIHHLKMRDYDRPDAEASTPATAPLDGTTLQGASHYLYVLKLSRAVLPSGLRFFEMAAHSRAVYSEHAPTLFFQFDIDPITTVYKQKQTALQFIVSLCGIAGGVVAASRLVAVFLG